jgi:hypothetical protein
MLLDANGNKVLVQEQGLEFYPHSSLFFDCYDQRPVIAYPEYLTWLKVLLKIENKKF